MSEKNLAANGTAAPREVTQTPQIMTDFFYRHMGRRIQAYAQSSNAQVAEITGVEGPVWVMDLYIGNTKHFAVYEEYSHYMYIYMGGLKYDQIVDIGQFYDHPNKFGQVFTDLAGNVCIKWTLKEKN